VCVLRTSEWPSSATATGDISATEGSGKFRNSITGSQVNAHCGRSEPALHIASATPGVPFDMLQGPALGRLPSVTDLGEAKRWLIGFSAEAGCWIIRRGSAKTTTEYRKVAERRESGDSRQRPTAGAATY
jgi:hypothetical protein